MRRTFAALGAALAAALAVSAPAAAAPPNPFGHPCTPQNGVLFCPTAGLSDRVPTWDGVPLDVDVTLPPDGDGPFPTIVMVHGLGASKTSFETLDAAGTGLEGSPSSARFHYNNVFYAQRGYAVVNVTLRGWGLSCGKADSRTPGDCDRGWTHLDDHAFEARDVQTLLGMLVDQGVTQPQAIGVTGISLGGGLTTNLGYLRDRMMLADGRLVPWTSPNGTPLAIAAAWSRWGWSDLAASLAPNGRFRESVPWKRGQSITPFGVEKLSFVNAFYLLTTLNFMAPKGGDPTADLATAKELSDHGEPYPSALRGFFSLLSERRSAAGLFGSTPAPLLLQDGWTDDIFSPQEALRIYRDTDGGRKGPVALQVGDLGHGRGANKPNENRFFQDQGAAFFDAYLKRASAPPAAGSVSAFVQTCPATKPSAGPFNAAGWAALHPGSFKLAGRTARKVTSTGGDPGAAKTFDKIGGSNPCETAPFGKGKGTALYSAKVAKGFTLIGLPLVKATVAAKGRFGQLDARLYDVFRGKETLVTRGEYRLTPNQRGKIAFQLHGGGWRFAKGHTVALELLGRDPDYLRPSNGRFSVKVSGVSAALPTRQRAPR
jgi:pimeloyl-ACP methyl ester carboxylesterase